MKQMKKNIGFLCIILVFSSMFSGCITDEPVKDNSAIITISGVNGIKGSELNEVFSSFYEINNLSINAKSESYSLPISLNNIQNNNQIQSRFQLSDTQKTLLIENGFLVIPNNYYDSITDVYENLKDSSIPVFVSSDSLLHVHHILFDLILKQIETRLLYEDILILTQNLLNISIQNYELSTHSDIQEAAKRNIAFFSVPLAILRNQTTDLSSIGIPSIVTETVTDELSFIEDHDGFHNSPLFLYREDYSQYIPRGHYTETDLLKQYFKAMMWYGRMSFLLKGGEPFCQGCQFLISSNDANIQTLQGFLISQYLLENTSSGESLDSIWERTYSITSFFVGTSDDLTPYMYRDALNELFEETSVEYTQIAKYANLLELKRILSLLPSPKIYGGTGEIAILKAPGDPFTIEDLNETLDKTKGMRLMGQRFILDSYMFQQLVFPAVDMYLGSFEDLPFTFESTNGGPTRAFPRGLDIMAALGSDLAYKILEGEGDTSYDNYDSQLELLRENVSNFNISDWNRNLYVSWLYTLQGLIEPSDIGYPLFMQTDAWAKKTLATALSSWSELRHDTILYAKQSYTPIKATSMPPQINSYHGFVEPVPNMYTRLLAMTKMTREGLMYLSAINQEEINQLSSFEELIENILNISIKELEGNKLSEEEYEYIATFDETLNVILSGIDHKDVKTTMVADVHTDTNSGQVLEEATGYINMAIVVYSDDVDSLRFAVGPVLSYYEFKHPMADRLTDESWIEMLEQGNTPNPPLWTSAFLTK